MSEENTGGNEENPGTSWRDSLAEDMRSDPHFERFNTLDDFAKSALNAQALIGRKGIVVPKAGDDPEVFAEYRKAVGVPESADGYAAEPLGTVFGDTTVSGLRETALKAGISPDAWAEIAPSIAGAELERRESVRAATQEKMESLRKEWGGEYEPRYDVANRAAHALFGESAAEITSKKLADGTAIGADPDFIKTLYAIGSDIGEGELSAPGDGGGGGMSPSEAKAEYLSIMGDPKMQEILNTARHPEHDELVARKSRLFKLSQPPEGRS